MFARVTKTIRNNVIVGLILVTPIVVTAFIASWLFTLTTSLVLGFVPKGVKASYPVTLSPWIALLIMIAVLFLIGLLARNILGKKLYQLGDMILGRIPVLNKIYIGVRQISETLVDQSQNLFKDVILVEYPRKGIYSMGFVTGQVPPDNVSGLAEPDNQKKFHAVFIPTSPNPTSGLVVFVSREDMHPLPMSVQDAMKLIVSGGAVFPGTTSLDGRPTLLDKLEEWMARQSKSDARQTRAGDKTALPEKP